jgi:dGTPase
LCRYADRIAYLTHDVADALRAGVLEYHDLPVRALTTFGATSRDWINTMVTSVIEASHAAGQVTMDTDHLAAMDELRDFMFERVYLSPESESQKLKAIMVIQDLVRYYQDHPEEVPDSYTVPEAEPLTRAIDYVAGMTDRYALHNHDRLFRPTLLD